MSQRVKKILLVFLLTTFLTISFCACSTEEGQLDNQISNEITEEQSKKLLSEPDSLPIGTVVTLDGYDRKVMIIGVLQINGSDQSVLYDYSGVVYPEGLIDPQNNYLFNKDQIERVYFLGYQTEEQEELQDKIDQAKENFYNQQ